jgi:hypothetical protein
VPDALSDAKAALAHANAAFPPAPKAASVPAKPAAPKPAPLSGLAAELNEKGKMMKNAKMALSDAPKMHKGGPIKADGVYTLKAGEHVLTAPEAAKARTHALMASGMKSLAKPAPKAPKGTASMTVTPMPKTTATDKTLASPVKPGMPSMTISPSPKAGSGWKSQSAIAHPGETARPTAGDVSKT